MKNTDRRKGVVALAVVVSLVVVAWIYLRPTSTPSTEDRAATATATATTSSTSPRPAAPAGAVPNLARPGDPPARAPVAIPAAMKQVLDDNPHLGQYYRLQQKVLPSEDERIALRGMLSDVELIQKLKADLLASEKVYSKEVEAKRMVEVEFFTDAVSWSDNPQMAVVTEAIEGVVFADNIAADAPEDLAQSLAGDKMELYTQMLHRAPERAALIAEHARGKNVESFLTYAKSWYEREMRGMKADELH
jgi:hypothetical protein